MLPHGSGYATGSARMRATVPSART
jgi:hypothetical protein